MPTKYYAVRIGKVPGIYRTWEDCKKQVMGYSGAEYKSFPTEAEAKAFILSLQTSEPVIADENRAVAYVDGSYLHEKRQFSFGAVFFWKGEKTEFAQAFSDESLASMRNVAGEIKGAEYIMQYCCTHQIPAVDIYYDYEGIEKWCTGAWKAEKAGTKQYVERYQEYRQSLDVRFIKVKGHSGVEYNERADKLAKSVLGIE